MLVFKFSFLITILFISTCFISSVKASPHEDFQIFSRVARRVTPWLVNRINLSKVGFHPYSQRGISIKSSLFDHTQRQRFGIEDLKDMEVDKGFIRERIFRDNLEAFPQLENQVKPFCSLLQNDEEVLGGIYGRTFLGVLQLKYIWVDKKIRREGYGLKLMREAEKFGVTNNCSLAILNAATFQCPQFYEKCGYILQYTQKGYNDDQANYHFSKLLSKEHMNLSEVGFPLHTQSNISIKNFLHSYTHQKCLRIEVSKDIEVDKKFIGKCISRDNLEAFPQLETQTKPFCFLLKNGEEALGGICGRTFLGVLQLEHLWVDKKIRRKGYGLELMREAEIYGVKNDCRLAIVDTTTFQNPQFYEKCGYILQYTQKGYNDDQADYYFSKLLSKDLYFHM